MPKVKVDEMLRFTARVSASILLNLEWLTYCVTNEPKFLPTMQCHVAPFLPSNCSCQDVWTHHLLLSYFSLDVLCNILINVSVARSRSKKAYLFNCEFSHCFLCCKDQS